MTENGTVMLAWERSARTIGLEFELYRADKAGFTPSKDNLLTRTGLFKYEDKNTPDKKVYYALVASSQGIKSKPSYAAAEIPVISKITP